MSEYMYVANTSNQHHVLLFCLTPGGKIYEQHLPIGQQVRLLDRKLEQSEIDYFIQKKEKYGYRNVVDLRTRGEKDYVGICFSIGERAVNLKEIKQNYEQNAEVLDDRRDKRLEDSTVAIANMLSQKVAPAPVPLKRSSVEFIEEANGQDPARIATGIEVDAPGVAPLNRSSGKSAKRR